MKHLKYLILFNIILFFYSCSTIKEGFTNQKKSSGDEFLVEKKSPLVMPPDYNELPKPENDKNSSDLDNNKIKSLVKNNEILKDDNTDTDQDFEETLLKKIKKN
tara:strand:+ start:1554 stop:1865 length:312 start_codon:yes stop_codon:yes gene_type:complete